jgi:ketosteroid isomerase-like protein
VRSPAEQEVVNTFQAIAKAAVARDADQWSKHVTDDFVLFSSTKAPLAKVARMEAIKREKESNRAAAVAEIQAMRLEVYGDGAAMITTEAAADNARPAYRAVRVWVKRNGQWQLAISAHTDVK